MSVDAMKLTLILDEIPVQLEEKKGEYVDYILREMDGGTKGRYLELFQKRWKILPQGGGEVLERMADLEAELICRCLWKKNADGGETLVSIEIIRKYPAAVHKELYKACRKLNAIGVQEEEAAKND